MARRTTKRGNNEGSISWRASDKRWQATISLGRDPATGKRRRQTWYTKTREEAAAKLHEALYQSRTGTLPLPTTVTLGAWLTQWLEEYKRPHIRRTTYDRYAMLMRRYLLPTLGHISVQQLRTADIQHVYNHLATHGRADGSGGLSAGTIQFVHTVLYGALTQAVRHGLVTQNVSTHTTRRTPQPRVPTTLSRAQVANDLQTAVQGERLAAAYLLPFYTGLRRGEVLGLQWSALDLDAGQLHVRTMVVREQLDRPEHGRRTRLVLREPKTAAARRTIPLMPECVALLRRHRAQQAQERLHWGRAYADHGLVFCRENGEMIAPGHYAAHFTRVMSRLGLPTLTPHTARHAST